ncbi:MAG: class I SAM-dependent methyltransferase [Candidatus Dormibacteria bacterium]
MTHSPHNPRLLERIRTRSGRLSFSAVADHAQPADPPQRLVWASRLALPVAGRRIADIGCWTGGLLALLVPLAPAELVGVDVSGPWLAVAEDTIPSATFLEVSSLTDIPSSLHRRFDVVFFLETLEHLPRGSQSSAVRTLASLLVPGGKVVLSTPAAGLSALLDPAWYLVGHRHYRLGGLVELLASAGLECAACHYSGNWWTSLDTSLLYVYKHLLRRTYSSPSAIAARASTDLYARRRLDSTNVWIEARSSCEHQ